MGRGVQGEALTSAARTWAGQVRAGAGRREGAAAPAWAVLGAAPPSRRAARRSATGAPRCTLGSQGQPPLGAGLLKGGETAPERKETGPRVGKGLF